MKKLSLILVGLLTLVAVVAVGCGGSGGEKTMKAALLTGGPVNDGGWNEMAFNGLKALEKQGYEISNTENVVQDGQKSAIQAYCDQGYTLIIGHGYEWADALTAAAKDYPDIKFLQIGGSAGGAEPNLASAEYQAYILGYLGGNAGALITKSNKFGFIGAQKIPTLVAEVDAIKAAAKKTNPDIQVIDVYTGSWTDVALGKTAAKGLIDQGCDVILGIGDACDAGAIQAVAEARDQGKEVWFIGWTGDFALKYPQYDFILTSCVQDVEKTIARYGEEVKDGTFKGEATTPGAVEGDLYLGTWSPKAPAEIKTALEDIQDKMISGELGKKEIFALTGMPQDQFYTQVTDK